MEKGHCSFSVRDQANCKDKELCTEGQDLQGKCCPVDMRLLDEMVFKWLLKLLWLTVYWRNFRVSTDFLEESKRR